MRNKIAHRTLGRHSGHRLALFRNMVEALVRHDRIRTTLAKAKEVRRFADNVVTWGKLGGDKQLGRQYHSRVHGFLRTPETVKRVFDVLVPRYSERRGGYTRVLRCGFRKGDQAPMAILEYVDREGEIRPARPPRAPPAPPPPPPPLEARLLNALRAQQGVNAELARGAVSPLLVPAFPRPHAPPREWEDRMWAPRSLMKRRALGGRAVSPLSSAGQQARARAPAAAAPPAKEPELR